MLLTIGIILYLGCVVMTAWIWHYHTKSVLQRPLLLATEERIGCLVILTQITFVVSLILLWIYDYVIGLIATILAIGYLFYPKKRQLITFEDQLEASNDSISKSNRIRDEYNKDNPHFGSTPNEVDLLIHTGNMFLVRGEYIDAINHFNEALKIEPNFPGALINRGNAYLHSGKYTEAINDFSEVIGLIPNNANLYVNRGNVILERAKKESFNMSIEDNYDDRLEFALEDYNTAIKLDNKCSEAYFQRGWCLFLMRDYEKAKLDFIIAKKLNKKFNDESTDMVAFIDENFI